MNKFKRIISLILVAVLVSLCACSEESGGNSETLQQDNIYNTPAGTVKKTETVYVNLDRNGDVTKTIVSDWLHTDRPEVYVDDVTNIKEFVNLKDGTKPKFFDNFMRWNLSSTDLYYQGETNAQLPLEFKLSYTLNGIPITPDELLGQSGKVEITVKMRNTDSYTVKIDGKGYTMYNPMLVVGGISLLEAKFQNISVKNGQIKGNGNTQVAVLVGFPGINDSLGLTDISTSGNTESNYSFDDTFVISADVTDFELGNIMFAAVPIASLDIGLNGITNSMDDVRENLTKLQSIQKTLQSIDAENLLKTLSSNPDKLKELSTLVQQASTVYDNNKPLIDVLNKYATPQNMETIQYLTAYISEADYDGLENALSVINSFFGDEASSEKIQQGITLLRALSEDLKNEQVQAAIQNLPQTVSTLSALQKAIEENKDLVSALKTLSESNALAALDTTLSGVEGSIAAGSLSQFTTITGDANLITKKMTGWIELGKKYTIFTTKLGSMDSSVMFVYKIDSIKGAKDSSNVLSYTEEQDGISSFFKKVFG